MNNFKSLYDVLEEALVGKRVRLRNYGGGGQDEKFIYDNDSYDGKPISWDDKSEYNEWEGVVKTILYNDNSHVDVIFDKNYPIKTPGKNFLPDCYNWHMGSYIYFVD